jgi:hypothetical protein
MYKITRLAIRNLFIIKKSFCKFSTLMQPKQQIKLIDWKTDVYSIILLSSLLLDLSVFGPQ